MNFRTFDALLTSAAILLVTACSARRSGADWLTAKSAEPRGAAIYARECASCHGHRGEGSRAVPEVVGPSAMPIRRGKRPPLRTALDVYDYVSTTMPLPPKKVGTLSDEQYWDVTEFLLQANGIGVPAEGITRANAADIGVN